MPQESFQSVAHYKIIQSLGEGGMGEVYLAQDTRLERTVALKILPIEASKDPQAMRRFLQEAKVASRLSHPNICVIHEVGKTETDERPFIAMEYIEGHSLEDLINSNSLELQDIIRIAIQVADALDEAHSKDVIHRDIKPSNVMLTKRGQVKVLDFGLAKITQSNEMSSNSKMETQAKTQPGILMGTVQYMSPEQALGKEIDARTDIFSFGVMLYQMSAGRLPFTGISTTETIDNILHAQPASIAESKENFPQELERIISKALRKKREERYQSAKEILVDLRNLSHEIDRSNVGSGFVYDSDRFASDSIAVAKAQTSQVGKATVSSAEYLISQIKSNRKTFLFASLLILFSLAGIAYGVYRFAFKKEMVVPFQKTELSRLTSIGNVSDAAISPKGDYIVYVVNDSEQQSLWIKHVPTNSTKQIIPPANVSYQGLDFSADGYYIYYNLWDKKSVGEIFRVPFLGGVSDKVIHDVLPFVKVSPDNKRIAFIRGYAKQGTSTLITANVDGTDERKVLNRNVETEGVSLFTWSPDGKAITVVTVSVGGDRVGFFGLAEISLDTGEERKISEHKWYGDIAGLAWLKDRSGLVLAASERQRETLQLWFVAYPNGEARQLTNDTNGYYGLSMSADSSSLIVMQGDVVSNIWITPVSDTKQSKKITSGKYEGFNLAWTPEGKILYVSGASGNMDIWKMNADGTDAKPLTNSPDADQLPCVSADGRYIIFVSARSGNPHIWRMDADGNNAVQITNGIAEYGLTCTSKNSTIVFSGVGKGTETVFKMSVEGGQPTVLADNKFIYNPAISPDGKWVAYSYWDTTSTPEKFGREALSLKDGKTAKQFELPQTAVGTTGRAELRWTHDSKAILFVDNSNGVSNLWALPIDGGRAKQITNFQSETIFSFDSSPDGKWIATARGVRTNDVFLIKDLK